MQLKFFKIAFILLCPFFLQAEEALQELPTEELLIEEAIAEPLPSKFVYIHQSKSGVLTQSKEGHYLLTLKENNLDLVYFADQPERITGQERLSPFFEKWKSDKRYLENPPTAFINYTLFNPQTEEGVTPDILELHEPKYNRENDTVTFQVKPLHEHPIKQGLFENVVIIYDKE